MKNLGPACERDLRDIGVTTADELISIGAEGAFLRILDARKRHGRSLKSINAIYLYALYGAIHDLDWRLIPESRKKQFLQLTSELRQSGVIP